MLGEKLFAYPTVLFQTDASGQARARVWVESHSERHYFTIAAVRQIRFWWQSSVNDDVGVDCGVLITIITKLVKRVYSWGCGLHWLHTKAELIVKFTINVR